MPRASFGPRGCSRRATYQQGAPPRVQQCWSRGGHGRGQGIFAEWQVQLSVLLRRVTEKNELRSSQLFFS